MSLLAQFCGYYLDCLCHEDLNGVSISARPNNGVLEYAELESSPFAEVSAPLQSPAVLEFFHRLEQDMNRKAFFLGYPLRLKGGAGGGGFKIEPLFLFSFEEPNAGENNSALLIDAPQINFEALKSLVNHQETSLLHEGAVLADKLGLEDLNGGQPQLLEEMLTQLRHIRPTWDWREDIQPAVLSAGVPLRELTQQGIYNRCILIAVEKSTYTRGLEMELKNLKDAPETEYGATALGRWLNPQTIAAQPVALQPLVEVVPLNEEQREAVQRSLSNPLTVISGPPGTGKSQVVASILANAAIQGKTVLFASKNNKAVDVVEARVNAAETRPILLRVGSQYPHSLREYLAALLGATGLGQDEGRFRECEARHAELQKSIAVVSAVLQLVVDLRNEVDRLEQQVEQTRTRLGERRFALLRHLDVMALERAVAPLRRAIRKADKTGKNLIVRSVWPLISKGRLRRVSDAGSSARVELDQLGFPLPDGVPESPSIEEWMRLAVRLAERMLEVLAIQQYFKKLDELNRSESMDALVRQTRKLTEASSACSKELWEVWLRLQPSRMGHAQREQINNITAQLTLRMEANNPPPGQAVFQRLFQVIPHLLPCWAVTSLSARNRIPFEPGIFDLLVIDEASQCDIASAIPLLFRAKQVVILGDLKQLPHISRVTASQDQQLLVKHGLSEERSGWSYTAKSLFDIAAVRCNGNIVTLRDHYRSHVQIIGFSNKHFYRSLRMATRYDRLRIPYPDRPAIQWVNVQGTAQLAWDGEAVNETEAQAVVAEIETLVFSGYGGSIGVVSPFRAQTNRIRHLVSQQVELAQRLRKAEFLCDTVHRFQGDERDVMFFSPAVSDAMPRGARWFVDASRHRENLFNVAITRARAALIVVGDRNAMLHCTSPHLQQFVHYIADLERTQAENDAAPDAECNAYPAVAHSERVSKWERYFYPHLCAQLLPHGVHPVPQYVVEQYDLDFALFIGDRKLNIEIDGEFYHRNWDGELCRRDQIRNQRLIDLGWDVMRFWVYQVRDDLELCLSKVEDWFSAQN